MKEKIKNILALTLLLLLLPYVITVFMSGKLRQASLDPGNMDTFISVETDGKVKEINFEDYVAGVTALQIPSGYEPEAIKSQMIIVRTNLRKKLTDEPDKLLSEKYLTMDKMEELGIGDKLSKAQQETRGQVMTFKGQLILASYHAISAGRTRAGMDVFGNKEYPYLTSVESGVDVEAKRFLHVEVYEPDIIIQSCMEQYPDLMTQDGQSELTAENLWENMEITKKDSAEYVLEIRIGNTLIAGEEFRKFLELNSSCFTMEPVDGGIRITTKGLGHGVGVSQFGAFRMAENGKSAQQILQYYYKEISIESIEKEERDSESEKPKTELLTEVIAETKKMSETIHE